MKMSLQQFRIGELAEYLNIEKFVIRFWEKEFDIKPQRSEGGQRFYTKKDLEHFQTIKSLLYDQGFTITGAKQALEKGTTLNQAAHKTTMEEPTIHELSKELLTLKKRLHQLKLLLS